MILSVPDDQSVGQEVGVFIEYVSSLICRIKRFDMCPVGRCGIGTSARQNVSTSEQVWQLIMSTSSRFMSSSMVRYLAKALEPCAVVFSSKRQSITLLLTSVVRIG